MDSLNYKKIPSRPQALLGDATFSRASASRLLIDAQMKDNANSGIVKQKLSAERVTKRELGHQESCKFGVSKQNFTTQVVHHE